MAVEHVVLLAWSPQTGADVRESAREIARSFPDAIPGVVGVAEGPSVSTEGLEGAYDYGLVVTFVDEAARDAYLPHPVHQRFVALVAGDATTQITVFDLLARD